MKSPFLDTIETPCTDQNSPKALSDKEYNDFFAEKLYNLAFYKSLALETSTALIDFSNFLHDKAVAMRFCGSNLTFDDKGQVISADFCRQRLCPMCQRRKSLKTYSDFCQISNYLHEYAFIHLVLTVPNCSLYDLRYCLERMEKASSRLFNIEAVKKAFAGVCRCTEVSYNKNSSTFHPHFHCLIAVKKSYFTSRNYISQKKLQRWWSVIWWTRSDNFRGLKDEYIDTADISDNLLQVHIEKADDGALPEIAKYAVKPLELELSKKERAMVLDALYTGLHSKRLIQTFGVIKDACKALKLEIEQSVDIDTLSEIDKSSLTVYNWNYATSNYEKKEI